MEIIKTGIVNLHNITLEEACHRITLCIAQPGLDVVVTPNIDHCMRLIESNDSHLKKIYQEAFLCLCDSRVLQKMLRLKGHLVKQVITGSTLTSQLFAGDMMLNKRIFIFGSDQSVIAKIRLKYPNHEFYHYNPPMGFIDKCNEVANAIQIIKQTAPDIIFLAVGSPRQEVFAGMLKSELNHGVALCIGASILFLAGEEKRAPLWVQQLHMEWFYRMLQNPKVLIKRYFNNFLQIKQIYGAL
jgi:exopolysaccharide biosynthesis WecB/TagA/CpsF family protein